jgi:hypothetical protein
MRRYRPTGHRVPTSADRLGQHNTTWCAMRPPESQRWHPTSLRARADRTALLRGAQAAPGRVVVGRRPTPGRLAHVVGRGVPWSGCISWFSTLAYHLRRRFRASLIAPLLPSIPNSLRARSRPQSSGTPRVHLLGQQLGRRLERVERIRQGVPRLAWHPELHRLVVHDLEALLAVAYEVDPLMPESGARVCAKQVQGVAARRPQLVHRVDVLRLGGRTRAPRPSSLPKWSSRIHAMPSILSSNSVCL